MDDTNLSIPKDDLKKIPNKLKKNNPLGKEQELKGERKPSNCKVAKYLKNATTKLEKSLDEIRNRGRLNRTSDSEVGTS
jgi:hypothetical protein